MFVHLISCLEVHYIIYFSSFCFCVPDAAYSLLHKKSRLFSLNGNNAILEFFIDGAPEIVETHLDSRKVS